MKALLPIALLLSGCCGERNVWSFQLSCSFYESLFERPEPIQPAEGTPTEALIVLIVLPFAIDTVILPVTGVHDLFFRN